MHFASSQPIRRFLTALTLLLTGLAFLFGSVLTAQAASEGRTTFANSLRKTSAATVTGKIAAPAAVFTANANAGESVEFQIALKMRDYPKLLARLANGERPTQTEMARRYYPLAADARAVADWAKSQGLTVVSAEANNLGVRVRGTVAQAQTALRTTFARVAYEGAEFTAATTAPSLPASVAGPVLGINGLQPFLHAQRHHTALADAKTANRPPYQVNEILRAYDAANVEATGAGQKIAVLIDTFPLDSDLTAFWAANSIPQQLTNIEKVNVTGAATLPAPEGEETLDVSWSSGVAPGAVVRVYATSDLTFSNLDKGLARIINDLPGQPELKILSISFGLGETYLSPSEVATESQYFATIVSYGVSVFVASGNAGSMPDVSGTVSGGGPLQAEYAATDPNVTAVGGTSLQFNSADGYVSSETAWSGSGGGASIFFNRPSYQTGLGVPAGTKRLVPDVALAADPNKGAYLVINGQVKEAGGTSWSTPTWAGFAALINESRLVGGLPSLGLLNPLIYPLIGTDNFRDITAGSNGPAGSKTYNAGAGFDEVTGIGVPDVGALLATLTNGANSALTVTNFVPAAGAPGTRVVIQGTGLGSVNAVSFGGIGATFTNDSATQITAIVPAFDPTVTLPAAVTITVSDSSSVTVNSVGTFTVLSPADLHDNFVNAQPITGSSATVVGSNVGATKEAGEPDHAGNVGGASVWYVWTAPTSGVFALNTFGSSFDTLLAVYTGTSVTALTPVASNDDSNTGVASGLNFNAVAGTVYYFAVDGFNGGSGPAEGNFVLNLAPALAGPLIQDFTPARGSVGTAVIITGTGFTGATGVTFNGTAAFFTVNTDTQITAVVPANATTGPITVSEGTTRTASSTEYFLVLPAPANDNFANAQVLSGVSDNVTGSNVGATKEPNEPDHAGNHGGASVWYVWTAPTSGTYSLDTTGSSFDTLLAVYTGTAVYSLLNIASNDDTGTLPTSSLTFAATANTVYYIAVDGFDGETGAINLNLAPTYNAQPTLLTFSPATGGAGVTVTISGTNFTNASSVSFAGTAAAKFTVDNATQIMATVPDGAASGPITVVTPLGTIASTQSFTFLTAPANDNFGAAQVLTGTAPFAVTGRNDSATKQAGEPNHAGNPGGRSVWYAWTAPSSLSYKITTRGSNFDTLLAVYTGNSLATLTLVAANDDDPAGGETSAVTFAATAGTTYRIAVDGSDGEAGDITLSILPAIMSVDLYTTGFEASEGFVADQPLVGQGGWVIRTGTGGNGVSLNADNTTQSAYIGFAAPNGIEDTFQIYHPLDYVPDAVRPVVTFSSNVEIVDSTNFLYDEFGFTIYNTSGDQLFSVIFDNFSLGIYYQLDDGNGLIFTGSTFLNSIGYLLGMTLDFKNNVWSATLGPDTIVSGQPITTLGSTLTLGDIDPTWTFNDPLAPGNNYMVFDNYSAVALTVQAPVITVQPVSQTVTAGNDAAFSVVAAGSQPLTYQWYYNNTAIKGATGATFGIANPTVANTGSYTVQVTNGFGTITSAAATLTVTAGPSAVVVPLVSVVTHSATASAVTGTHGKLFFLRSGDTTMPLTVNYKVGGDAQPNVDYRALSGTVMFAAGESKVVLKIEPVRSATVDASVTKVKIKLAPGADYILGDPSKAKVTITHEP